MLVLVILVLNLESDIWINLPAFSIISIQRRGVDIRILHLLVFQLKVLINLLISNICRLYRSRGLVVYSLLADRLSWRCSHLGLSHQQSILSLSGRGTRHLVINSKDILGNRRL